MKNVYFVQVDVSATMGVQSAYLPYAAGTLAANAWTSESVKKSFRFKEFIFLRENISDVLVRMDEPAIVAFSNYCWNTEYNKALAFAVKKEYSHCITVFGGHNVPDDFSFLEKFPYIDVLCHGEGEETVKELFSAIAEGRSLSDVPNISFRDSSGGFVRTKQQLCRELDYPSPYVDGWFDPLISAHPEITFNAILETSRGCPHQCAYCDWGLLKSKVRLFPMERVMAEIEWMSTHKIAFVWGADANFGLFSRDLEIADALVRAKETTGYPERMRMNYAKNNFKNVFAIVQKFKECEFDRIGATLSFQSMSPEVLRNIGRTNNDLSFYKDLLTEYNKANMKTYSELILGLPGETYESFIHGIGMLFEIGQHFVFQVYGCILLPNSILWQKAYVEKFGIKTVRTEIVRAHVKDSSFAIPEYNDLIVETSSMSREMWVRSLVFYFFSTALHAHGFLRAFAIYLFVEKHLPYERFYDGILNYFESHPELWISSLYVEIKDHVTEQSLGMKNRKLVFEPCGDIVWDDYEYIALRILEKIDTFYEETLPYLNSFDIAPDIFNDLMAYQRGILRTPFSAVARLSMHYDIHGFMTDTYINDLHPLSEKQHTLVLRDSDPKADWSVFGKQVIWYGRMGWASYKEDVCVEEDEV